MMPTTACRRCAGATAPANWLLCDGSAVSRTTYADLFAVCGETYGAGNGSTTFNVPDLRQKFPLGKAASGTGSTLGGTGGAIDHTHTGPSHTHTVSAHTHTIAHTHSVGNTGWGGTQNAGAVADGQLLAGDGAVLGLTQTDNGVTSGASSAADSGSTALTTNSGGTGTTGTGNPPFMALTFLIKT